MSDRCKALIASIECMWAVIAAFVLGLTDIIDRGKFGKKALLYVSIWLTVDSYWWARQYVEEHADKPGLEIAAIIGAVLLCVSALQAAVLKYYLQESTETKRIETGV